MNRLPPSQNTYAIPDSHVRRLMEAQSEAIFENGLEGEDAGSGVQIFTSHGSRAVFSSTPIQSVRKKAVLSKCQAWIAGTYIDLWKVGEHYGQTQRFDIDHLVAALRQDNSSSILVSDALRVTREDSMLTSLMVPSGGYLAWMEMDDEAPYE